MFEIALFIALLIAACIMFPVVFHFMLIVAFILAICGFVKWLFPGIGEHN